MKKTSIVCKVKFMKLEQVPTPMTTTIPNPKRYNLFQNANYILG